MNRRQALLMLCAVPGASLVWAADSPAGAQRLISVHKTRTCGCCKLWIEHLQQAGFAVEAHDVEDVAPIKQRVGVPANLASCHTAEVDGYFIEGHVPAADVKRLLTERPAGKGLTVPGMPLGSPGMEVATGQVDQYEVLLIAKDGSSSVYASYGG